jgi:lia operon protein LiaG
MKSGSWRRIGLGVVSLGLGALMMPSTGLGQEEHRVRGDEVAVYNLAGTVEIVPGSGGDVVVQVMRGGADARQLEVGIQEVDGRQALVIRYPADQVIYPELGEGSRTQIRVRNDGTFFGDGGSSNTREVRISGSGSGMEAWADLRIAVPGGQDFALFLAAGETNLQGLNGDVLIDTGSGAVHARASSGNLSIDTGSGAVTVQGFDGDLEVDTGSGSVELSDVRGDHVRIDTGSGSVGGSNLVAASLGVDTGSGAIDLRGVSAPDVILDTGSGSVEVELLEDVDRLEIDTGSGSVTIWVPSSVGAEVEMETGAGGIDLDLPLEVREAKRDYVRGILGDGDGRIHVDTGSGAIRLIGR